jgi:hypothetical protein
MLLGSPFIIVLFASLLLIIVYFNALCKDFPKPVSNKLHRYFPLIVIINIVSFSSVALYFNHLYGYITDDFNYFRGALTYTSGFFEIKSGNEFMYFISRPLRKYLFLDRASCHALFGALGFLGSLNFLYVLIKRTEFGAKIKNSGNRIKIYSICCFPNFMVWGRIYGKDSTTLFLGSVYLVGVYNILVKAKLNWRNFLMSAIPIVLLFKLRPHIAAVFAISLMVGLYLRSINLKTFKNPNLNIFYKIIFPTLMVLGLVFGTVYSLKMLTHKEIISVQNIRQSLINSTRMGATGGSQTPLAEEFREDPNIVLSPRQVGINVFMLLFAPMPWQLRGSADAIALVSNILLLLLIIRFIKNVNISDIFQKYLLVVCGLLILLLSFMTGNVGLILRQKTILLPFVFLFLFRSKANRPTLSPSLGNGLPHKSMPAIQT